MTEQAKEELIRIIGEIEVFIAEKGSIYSDWYVGTTKNIQEQLYRCHNVKENCITVKAPSIAFARIIERYFIEDRRTDGVFGSGDDDDFYVYAYKKQQNTHP